MTNRWTRAFGLLAAALACGWLCAAASTEAQAGPTTPPPPPGWTLRIPDLLHLDAQQAAAFQVYVSALPDPKAQPAPLSAEQFGAMAMPRRLDFVADHMAADLAKQRELAHAMQRFYAVLSPDQRQRFDDATRPPTERLEIATDGALPFPPQTPDYQLPSHTNPHWLIMPQSDDLQRIYPTAALKAGVAGLVHMACTADDQGYLKDCVVRDETPAGLGFGNAALEATGYMRMYPATNFGVPARAFVIVPLRFSSAK